MAICSFLKTSFDTHYFKFDRIIALSPTNNPAFVFTLVIFWSDFDASSHLLRRCHVLYRSLCSTKVPLTCSPNLDCGRGQVNQQIRKEMGYPNSYQQ